MVYEPIEEEMNEFYYDGFFKFLRETKEPLLVVVDELASIISQGGKAPHNYDLMMKQGRSKFQAIWAGIQNPIYVPPDFLRQADHFYIFDLLTKDDREKMKGIVGDGVMTPPINEHGFYYFAAGKKTLEYFPNDPAIDFGAPSDYLKHLSKNKGGNSTTEGGEKMNWKFLAGLFFFALVMVLLTPIWKIIFRKVAATIPATQIVNDYVQQA
jgi:hypothetical protein